MPRGKKNTIPMGVSFNRNETDWYLCQLLELGLSTRAIARETGLTPSQVNYRAHHAGIKRGTYRDADSKLAKTLIRSVDGFWSKEETEKQRLQLERKRKRILKQKRLARALKQAKR